LFAIFQILKKKYNGGTHKSIDDQTIFIIIVKERAPEAKACQNGTVSALYFGLTYLLDIPLSDIRIISVK
jgi:hypothetical protein